MITTGAQLARIVSALDTSWLWREDARSR